MEMNAIVAGLTSRFATAKKKLKRYVARLSERPHMAKSENYYDEDLDQPIAAPGNDDSDNSDKKDSRYESFLAPKASFPSGIEVGSMHKVKVERILDDEIQLVCSGKDKKEESESENDDELYD